MGDRRYSLQTFLTSALDEDVWSTSRSDRFIPMERTPGTHFIGSWMGPRVGLDTVATRKIPDPVGNLNLVIQSVA